MIDRLRRIFQNRQEFQGELAAEPTVYHKGDIVRREEPNGGYQFGIIKKVRKTGTPIEILTFEIHEDYTPRDEKTGNFKGIQLKLPSNSENLFIMQRARPKNSRFQRLTRNQ